MSVIVSPYFIKLLLTQQIKWKIIRFYSFSLLACRAAVSLAEPACSLVLPAQIWLSDLSMDGIRDQQTGARLDS